MAKGTAIEWTDASWNVVTGCDEISAGCDHCYAHTLTDRLQRMGSAKYAEGWAVRTHPQCLDEPRTTIRKPSLVFTCSMGDLFHARVGYDFAQQVWQVMTNCSQHSFQVLTKRTMRSGRFSADHPAPANVWLGTSVEDQRVLHRVDALRACSAQIRFLSCEPLIGPLPDLDLSGISWVIVGGESGARGEWGGSTPKAGGRLLDGRLWNQFPDGTGGVIDLGQDPLPPGLTIKMALNQATAAVSASPPPCVQALSAAPLHAYAARRAEPQP